MPESSPKICAMLRIRLQRTGRENLPTFRVVVAEHSKPVKGKYQEILGYFLPARSPKVFECKTERIVHWIKHGARPSNTVARLLKRHGFKEQGIDLEPFIEPYTKKKKKGEQKATEETKETNAAKEESKAKEPSPPSPHSQPHEPASPS